MTKSTTRRPPKVLTSRNYVHLECGELTSIEGPEFTATADPFNEIVQTQCAACECMCCISEFQWEDTGENIAEYQARYREMIPDDVREEFLEACGHSATIRRVLIGAVIGTLLGIGCGVLAGIFLHWILGIAVGLLGVLVLGGLGALSLEWHRKKNVIPALRQQYLGVSEVGELR
jgi:hypothetical protein